MAQTFSVSVGGEQVTVEFPNANESCIDASLWRHGITDHQIYRFLLATPSFRERLKALRGQPEGQRSIKVESVNCSDFQVAVIFGEHVDGQAALGPITAAVDTVIDMRSGTLSPELTLEGTQEEAHAQLKGAQPLPAVLYREEDSVDDMPAVMPVGLYEADYSREVRARIDALRNLATFSEEDAKEFKRFIDQQLESAAVLHTNIVLALAALFATLEISLPAHIAKPTLRDIANHFELNKGKIADYATVIQEAIESADKLVQTQHQEDQEETGTLRHLHNANETRKQLAAIEAFRRNHETSADLREAKLQLRRNALRQLHADLLRSLSRLGFNEAGMSDLPLFQLLIHFDDVTKGKKPEAFKELPLAEYIKAKPRSWFAAQHYQLDVHGYIAKYETTRGNQFLVTPSTVDATVTQLEAARVAARPSKIRQNITSVTETLVRGKTHLHCVIGAIFLKAKAFDQSFVKEAVLDRLHHALKLIKSHLGKQKFWVKTKRQTVDYLIGVVRRAKKSIEQVSEDDLLNLIRLISTAASEKRFLPFKRPTSDKILEASLLELFADTSSGAGSQYHKTVRDTRACRQFISYSDDAQGVGILHKVDDCRGVLAVRDEESLPQSFRRLLTAGG